MNASARRIEIGPVLLVLGALLLFASLFTEWFEPELTAWNAFEWLDLLLAVIALLVIVAALGLLLPGRALLDADVVPLLVAAPLAIVAVQLLDPPPFVADGDPATGAWLALGGCLLMGAGAVLSFGRMRLSISFEGRDVRHRVSAVDARGSGTGASAPGDGSEGLFDQAAAGRSRAVSGTPKGSAGPGSTSGGAAEAGTSGASAAAGPAPRERPAWSRRPDAGGRRAGATAGATRAEPGRDPGSGSSGEGGTIDRALPGRRGEQASSSVPAGPSGDAFAPPIDAPTPAPAVAASEPAATPGSAAPAPDAAAAGTAASQAGEGPPDAVAPADGERRAEPSPEGQPPPGDAPSPETESPRRSGGLFGSWFDEPTRGDDDEDAAAGPGGSRPAGS